MPGRFSSVCANSKREARIASCIVCTAFATFASVDAKADTIWVDVANYGTAGLTGATKALAYGTIQDAFGLFRSAVLYFSISSLHVSCGAEEAGMKGWCERANGTFKQIEE